MILSNVEIVRGLCEGWFTIDPIAGLDPNDPPFNSSAIDLRLGDRILLPRNDAPIQLDLRKGGIASFWAKNSDSVQITERQPLSLDRGKFVLANTLEYVEFPIRPDMPCFAARVEGRSSLARCGILVHFTAPTIHAGFAGTITLEIINLGVHDFLLIPGMAVCQLIIEEVKGSPVASTSQFRGQTNPAGVV